jgi:hypothetical protein
MNNSQVAHIWAQGKQKEAKGSNFFCVSDRLYSYRTLIGQIIDGQAFITSNSMTQRTSMHRCYANRATNYTAFNTPAFHYNADNILTPEQLITAAADEMPALLAELSRKRTYLAGSIALYMTRRDEIYTIAGQFKIEIADIAGVPEELHEKARDFAATAQERENKKLENARKRLQAQQVRDKKQFEAWISTGAGSCPGSYQVRGKDQITIRGKTVVTSQGADVPRAHVIRALAFYRSRQIAGEIAQWEPYQTNGHKIILGHFTLDSIDGNGNVRAGCHAFSAAEIVRFCAQWGL